LSAAGYKPSVPEMDRIYQVLFHPSCRETREYLMSISFADFTEFEERLFIRSLYEEEMNFNRTQLEQRK